MKKFLLPAATGLILLLSSCGDFQEVTLSGLENVNVTKLSREGVEAEITARINNPNSTSFTVYRSDMDVTLNGINCGKAHLSDNVRIGAHCEKAYTFHIKSDFSKLSLADLPKVISLAMSRNARIGLKGDLHVGKLLYKRSYPVELIKNIPLTGL